jgi:hypothetical protein
MLREPRQSAANPALAEVDGEVVDGAIIYEIPDRATTGDPDERDLEEELAVATAEVEHLRERVATLETWLDVAARRRRVEYVQAQRLAMLKALERDDRFRFVLTLPVAVTLLYAALLGVVVFVVLGGRW